MTTALVRVAVRGARLVRSNTASSPWHVALIPIDPRWRRSRTLFFSRQARTCRRCRSPRGKSRTRSVWMTLLRRAAHRDARARAAGIWLIGRVTRRRQVIAVDRRRSPGVDCMPGFHPMWFFGVVWSFYVFSLRLPCMAAGFIQTCVRRRGRAARARERIRVADAVLRQELDPREVFVLDSKQLRADAAGVAANLARRGFTLDVAAFTRAR